MANDPPTHKHYSSTVWPGRRPKNAAIEGQYPFASCEAHHDQVRMSKGTTRDPSTGKTEVECEMTSGFFIVTMTRLKFNAPNRLLYLVNQLTNNTTRCEEGQNAPTRAGSRSRLSYKTSGKIGKTFGKKEYRIRPIFLLLLVGLAQHFVLQPHGAKRRCRTGRNTKSGTTATRERRLRRLRVKIRVLLHAAGASHGRYRFRTTKTTLLKYRASSTSSLNEKG